MHNELNVKVLQLTTSAHAIACNLLNSLDNLEIERSAFQELTKLSRELKHAKVSNIFQLNIK